MTRYAPVKGMSASAIEELIGAALGEMSLEEKVEMMSGHGVFESFTRTKGRWCAEPYRAGGGCERLGIPALYFSDGPRGVCAGRSTCFPVSMARGASFDPDLERRIGEAMSIEYRAQGRTLTGAVCINLLRHPAWGRAQETYGEDPYLLGEMGAAFATGLQTHNVVATVKHFALNSMENARFKVDVRIDPRALHEVYLPHFKRTLDAGCASVMSAYNKMNGEHCGQNRVLLTDILRHQWGFDGFVHSDWVKGVLAPYGAAAGLDVENPEPIVFGAKLVEAVRAGAIEPEVIETACRRILRVIYRFACAEDPLPHYDEAMIASPAHTGLALEAALKSAVLLKNDGVLPLDPQKTKRLAVLGRLAALKNTGDHGSSRVAPPYTVTALEGLQRYAEGRFDIVTADESDLDGAARIAASADAVLVIAGYTAEDEGEFIPGDITLGVNEEMGRQADVALGDRRSRPPRGGDRADLGLPASQRALIKAAAASGRPVTVVLVAGSAVLAEDWIDDAAAILQTFYSGMEGGTALAQLVFGEVSPSGKLPFTVARDAAHYPFFDRDADQITYDLFHGYLLLERDGHAPRFPFGFGLSYARFAYRALKLHRAPDAIIAEVSVRNDGTCAAAEVAQLYVGFPGKAVERPRKLLRGFQRVMLQPGETRTLRFRVELAGLGWWNEASGGFTLEPGVHHIYAGGSSSDSALLSAAITL